MRALVFTRPGVVELRDVSDPAVSPGEVLVTVAAAGICGSELHGVVSGDLRQPPLIMGHEFTGFTADGRRVVVNPLLSCGACQLCRLGLAHLCLSRQILGIHRPGAFAQRVSVPEDAVHLLPDDVDLGAGALIEPLANAVHALALARPATDARIAVIGAGTIGLMALLVARERSEDVVVCDTSVERLELARKLGASRTTASLGGEAGEVDESFDLVIDAVGAAATHAASVSALRRGGTAVWVGLLSSEARIDAQQIVRDEKRVTGSYCYTKAEFAEAVALARRLPLGWATGFALTEGPTIFTELMNGRHDVVKAVLDPTT
jgi:alcohol dehydrogenase